MICPGPLASGPGLSMCGDVRQGRDDGQRSWICVGGGVCVMFGGPSGAAWSGLSGSGWWLVLLVGFRDCGFVVSGLVW